MRKAVKDDLIRRLKLKIKELENELDEQEEAVKQFSETLDCILAEVVIKYGKDGKEITIPVPDVTKGYKIKAVKDEDADQSEKYKIFLVEQEEEGSTVPESCEDERQISNQRETKAEGD